MIFAFGEDGIITVFEDEAAVVKSCEPIDVECEVYVFYGQDGQWLRPRFVRPNRRRVFGLLLEQGTYVLEPAAPSAGVDPVEIVLAEARGVEPNPHFSSVSEIESHIRRNRAASGGAGTRIGAK